MAKSDPDEQTPDQFTTGPEPTEGQEAPASHATTGMTVLGFTEASRIEGHATAQEAERKARDKG